MKLVSLFVIALVSIGIMGGCAGNPSAQHGTTPHDHSSHDHSQGSSTGDDHSRHSH